MNLGDLIVLVLFVLFVLLPQLNRGKQPQRPQTPGRRAGRPAPTGRPVATTPATVPTSREAGAPIFPEDPEDEFARRLAEARERVRQAASVKETVSTASVDAATKERTAASLVTDRGSRVGGGTAVTAVDPRIRARGPLVAEARPAVAAIPLGQRSIASERSRELRRQAAPIEVERLGRSSMSGVSDRNAPLDLGDWRQGFLWHQVLSAPRARRRLGGGPFPPQ